jgi:O-antigen/teichoic acid export membrane protein
VLARRNAVQGIFQAAWSVGLGVAGAAPLGLASSLAAGRAAGMVGLGFGGLTSTWGQPRSLWLRIRIVWRRYKRFPLVVAWARLVNGIGLQLPVLLVGALYGSVALGLLALTLRVLASPVGMVADATSQYFESTFASRLRNQEGGLFRMVVTLSIRLALVGAIPTLAIAVFGRQLYEFVFGAQWGIAGDFASIVVVGYFVQLIVSPTSKALNLLQRQGAQLSWDIARAIAVGGSIVLPASLGMSIEVTLVTLTAAQVASYAALLLLVLMASRRQDAASTSLRQGSTGGVR